MRFGILGPLDIRADDGTEPPAERRIRSRDRMYRLLASRPLAALFTRITEKSATNIKLPEYPR